MKAIMISIKPKYVAKILNGEKTIEIRKTMPKCDLPIDVYIYCTKDNYQLVKPENYDKYLLFINGAINCSHEQTLNSKVVAKFTLNKVEEIKFINPNTTIGFSCEIGDNDCYYDVDENKCCLNQDELFEYGVGKLLYAWHISNLEIFDRPKELEEFELCCGERICVPLDGRCLTCSHVYDEDLIGGCDRHLKKPFQSWGYVEVEE